MVKYDDVAIREKFNKSYKRQIVEDKSPHRAATLFANLIPLQAMSKSQIEECENMDNKKQRAMKIASKQCRKRLWEVSHSVWT